MLLGMTLQLPASVVRSCWMVLHAIMYWATAHRSSADTAEEAHTVAKALCNAGVVLRFRSQVYLRPDEVAHAVLSVGSRTSALI